MTHIRISQAGACPRRLQLEAWGVDGLPPWEGSERAFAEGNLHESSILEWAAQNLPGGPYALSDQQREVVFKDEDCIIAVGHIDAIATNDAGKKVLLEAKWPLESWFPGVKRKRGAGSLSSILDASSVIPSSYWIRKSLFGGPEQGDAKKPHVGYVLRVNID